MRVDYFLYFADRCGCSGDEARCLAGELANVLALLVRQLRGEPGLETLQWAEEKLRHVLDGLTPYLETLEQGVLQNA